MKKVNYITTSELGDICNDWVKNNPHNNGYAIEWEILEPEESGYPDIETYFITIGLKVGDSVIVHSVW